MVCCLHVWRCTADVRACCAFYEPLTEVTGECESWRKIVVSQPELRWKFVQANTFLVDGKVEVSEYEESNEGSIRSWAERCV
jgi:dipeptidyl-peptidase-3